MDIKKTSERSLLFPDFGAIKFTGSQAYCKEENVRQSFMAHFTNSSSLQSYDKLWVSYVTLKRKSLLLTLLFSLSVNRNDGLISWTLELKKKTNSTQFHNIFGNCFIFVFTNTYTQIYFLKQEKKIKNTNECILLRSWWLLTLSTLTQLKQTTCKLWSTNQRWEERVITHVGVFSYNDKKKRLFDNQS